MPRARHALVSLLIEAGLTPSRSRHIAANLDRLRLGGLGSDDLAALLLTWSHQRHQNRTADVRELVPLVAVPDINGQIMLFQLPQGREGRGRRD